MSALTFRPPKAAILVFGQTRAHDPAKGVAAEIVSVHRQCRREGGPAWQSISTKSRPDQKIDAAVALMMSIGRAMVEDKQAKGLDGFLANRSLDKIATRNRCWPQYGALCAHIGNPVAFDRVPGAVIGCHSIQWHEWVGSRPELSAVEPREQTWFD